MARDLSLPAIPESQEFIDQVGVWRIRYRLGRSQKSGARVIRSLTIEPWLDGAQWSPSAPLRALSEAPDEGITWKLLRRIPLGSAARYAREVIETQDPRGRERPSRPPEAALGRPPRYDHRFYARVAASYRALVRRPDVLVRVAAKHHLKYATARGIIARCRMMGLLGPSGRSRRKNVSAGGRKSA
jgi:hypothetical protein